MFRDEWFSGLRLNPVYKIIKNNRSIFGQIEIKQGNDRRGRNLFVAPLGGVNAGVQYASESGYQSKYCRKC